MKITQEEKKGLMQLPISLITMFFLPFQCSKILSFMIAFLSGNFH